MKRFWGFVADFGTAIMTFGIERGAYSTLVTDDEGADQTKTDEAFFYDHGYDDGYQACLEKGRAGERAA